MGGISGYKGQTMMQSGRGDPKVIVANGLAGRSKLPGKLARPPSNIAIKLQDGVVLETKPAVVLPGGIEAFRKLAHTNDADVKRRGPVRG